MAAALTKSASLDLNMMAEGGTIIGILGRLETNY